MSVFRSTMEPFSQRNAVTAEKSHEKEPPTTCDRELMKSVLPLGNPARPPKSFSRIERVIVALQAAECADVNELVVLADNAIFVDELRESGKTTTKADLLAFMRSADYKPESETFDDIHSKQFGDTVVLGSRNHPRHVQRETRSSQL